MNGLFRGILITLVALACSSSALADAPFDRAVRLYQQKDYRGAIAAFSEAQGGPTVYYYAALCYQQLNDTDHAKQFYQLICDNFPKSPEAPLAAQGLKQLTAEPPNPLVTATTPSTTSSATAPELKLPDRSSSALAVNQFLKSYKMTDEEWNKMPNELKVPFTRATSGHLFVNGSINGRSMRMMFDTGAEPSVFSSSQLASAGVKVDPTGPLIKMAGVAGTASGSIMLADVAIGDLKRRIPIVITSGELGFPIIGQSFFREFKYNIDNGGGFISFMKAARPGSSSKVYESTDVIKVPFIDQGKNMIVEAKINGKRFPMIFDTGAYTVCFSSLHAAALGLQIPPDAQQVVSRGAGGMVPGYKFYVDRIELGALMKTHVEVVVNAGMTPMHPLLGQPFFRDRKFTIDNEKRTINFSR